MVKEITARRLATAVVLAVLAFAQSLGAHQLDEYLQSTLVAIGTNEIHLSIHLTPGTAIADQVLARIKTNAYPDQFTRDLTVTLDQHVVAPGLTELNLPEQLELTNGFGMIELEFSIPITLQSGPHTFTIENRHLPMISAYLVNAAAPQSPYLQITSQTRNETQSTSTIAFTYQLPIRLSKKVMTFAILSVLYCAMLAGVWRLQTRHKTTPT